MKYIDQIFYEGLGTTLFIPIEKLINRNKKRKVLTYIIKILYFIFAIYVMFLLFYIKFPIKFLN